MVKITTKILKLIKKYEGYRDRAYLCPAGVWTIGYGFTYIDGLKVVKGGTINRIIADKELKKQILKYESELMQVIKNIKINQNQHDALLSFVYNLGITNFKKSTLLKKLKKYDFIGASLEFVKWDKVNHKELSGLKKRRLEEKKMFLET